MRDYDILMDDVFSFRSVLDAISAGESDVLFISDDFGAVQVLWDGLRRRAAKMPVACAFVDFAKMALSPSLLVSAIGCALEGVFADEELDADRPPRWLVPPKGLDATKKRSGVRLHAELVNLLDGFIAEASSRSLRPVVAMKDLTSLKALKSYKGVDDAFAIMAKALAKFPELRIVALEYGQSTDAVFEITGKCLRRTAVRPILMPRLSAQEVSAVAAVALDAQLSEEECETLRSLCDGRLSYLLSFCDSVFTGGVAVGKGELVSLVADALVDPLSELSRTIRSRMTDAISNVRGDTVLRHIARVLSFGEGMTASEAATKIERSVPATYDYLKWLLRSLLLTKRGARYFFNDRLLKLWLKLDTLAAGSVSGIPRGFARRMVSDTLLEAPPDEGPEPVAPAELPTAASEEQDIEDEYRIEVVRPKEDDMLEYD